MHMQKNELVDYLFLRFAFAWDGKWKHILKDGEEEKRKIWAVAISGLTRPQLNKAIDVAIAKFDWPPEPRKFLECCGANKKPEVPSIDMTNRICIDRKNNIWISKCTVTGCENPGTMSREVRGDNYICNKHWREGK